MSPSRLQTVPDIPAELLDTYLSAPLVAVDTELQGLRLRRDHVCLVQLCDREQNICLVKPETREAPPNLRKLLTAPEVVKIFHYAVSDVAFFKVSMNVDVEPFHCTKVMSKLIRTYSDSHSLRTLVSELVGVELDKEQQNSNWDKQELSPMQLQYAANDVLFLIQVYDELMQMIENRAPLPTGISAAELNRRSQACLPTVVDLLVNGYGDRDQGWESSLFSH